MKEYFSHDYNAIHDPKCAALISKYGIAAYGTFWMLVEIMHEQGGRIEKFPTLYDGLAHELRIPVDILTKHIEAMLHEVELFKEDDRYIWSERVLKNIEEREAKRLSKIEAGRLGGKQSGIIRRSKTKQCFEANEANEANKSKVNKIKVKEIKEDILSKDNTPKGDTRIEFLFQKIKELTGMPPVAGQQSRRYAYNLIRQLEKEKKDGTDIETAIEMILKMAIGLDDTWHAPKAHDPKHLFYHWQEIVQLYKQKKQNGNIVVL